LREKLSTICNNKPKTTKNLKKLKLKNSKKKKQKQKIEFFSFLGFSFLSFCGFWFVVAYCTQLLSQAMYNLMMVTMAETCSCSLPSTI